jgi:hypothetical protein
VKKDKAERVKKDKAERVKKKSDGGIKKERKPLPGGRTGGGE